MDDLRGTVDGMLSDDHRERLAAEYRQLEIRRSRLEAMLRRWRAGELGFEPSCPAELLIRQLAVMTSYKSVLEKRAEAEGVEL